MYGDRAGFRQYVRFAIGEVDGVTEQGLVAHQAVTHIDIGIVSRFGIEFAGIFDLVQIFGKMRLDEEIGKFLRQRLGGFHLLRRGGDGEAGVMATWLRPLPCQSAIT